MAKYRFEVDYAGDLIYGEVSVILSFRIDNYLSELGVDFRNITQDIIVSDEQIDNPDISVDLTTDDDGDIRTDDEPNQYLCNEEFKRFFPLDTKKLYLKVINKENDKIEGQNQEPGERNPSLQD